MGTPHREKQLLLHHPTPGPPHPAALCGVPAPQAWGPVGAGEMLEGRVLREKLLDPALPRPLAPPSVGSSLLCPTGPRGPLVFTGFGSVDLLLS